MPPIKTRDLLDQLSHLETSLNSFSFEKLPVDEANNLKETFRIFKQNLEDKIWGTVSTSPDEIKNELKREISIIDSSINSQSRIETIDLEPILEDCMGEMAMLEELIQLYKQNALEFIGKGRISLDKNDFEQLRFALHKIKNGLRMMNTTRLLELVESMQNICKTSQDISYLRFLYDCFVTEYPVIEAVIDEQFKVLRTKNND